MLYAGLARLGAALPLTEREGVDQPDRRAVCLTQSPPGTSAIFCSARRHRTTRPHGRIAFKTGTSYGYRDAWAIGFDGRMTIGVWVGRPDGAPVPGLVGRARAAPILFDAFARSGSAPTPLPRAPKGAIFASGNKLPPPLQRFAVRSPNEIGRATAHHVSAGRRASRVSQAADSLIRSRSRLPADVRH